MAADFDKGSRIRVKCRGGGVRTNVVWEVAEGLVYLCSERQYEDLKAGREAPPPIGFPLEDVCRD